MSALRQAARIRAAAEILAEIFAHHRPATLVLADWGKAHRFAGSGDRAAIGNLVFDALRRRQSLAAQMVSEEPRALAIAAAPAALGMTPEELIAAADGSKYALTPLTEEECAGLARECDEHAPAWVRGDYPQWLAPHVSRVFGSRAAIEGAALAKRAPVDLRVNTLKANREKVLHALARYKPNKTPLSPIGIRIKPPTAGERQANVEAEASHGRGWFEVQDEASQIAACLCDAGAKMQVLDYCAGAGGKTLALSAMMENAGQIYAFDKDKQQIRPIFERLRRAGARNTQVLDAGDLPAIEALGQRFDVVLVDAPCTGTGTWRRRPESKWRLKPANLEARQREQRAVLAAAALSVKTGGRLVYVTCSILGEENIDIVTEFLGANPTWRIKSYRDVWQSAIGGDAPVSADGREDTLLLTPARHGTDGFFIAILEKPT